MYSYVVTSQKPTAVNHAFTCNFTSADEKNLIVVRGGYLEISNITPDNVEKLHEFSLYGRIECIGNFRPPKANKDVLLILTSKKYFCMLEYDSANKFIETRATGNLRDRVARENVSGMRVIIDPEYRVAAFSMYHGSLRILPLDNTAIKEAIKVQLDILTYIDIKFLYGCSRPTLCALYEDQKGARHIKTYIIDQREKELLPGPWNQNYVESKAKMIIPVASPINGILVVGEKTIAYYNGTGITQSVIINSTDITSYCALDINRYIVGDIYGQLSVLVLIKNEINNTTLVKALAIDLIGTTSIPECICALDHHRLFIGSVYGDNQLIQLHTQAEIDQGAATETIEVLQTYSNIGPILDMCVIQSERSGQTRIVTCSGAYKDGSLRVVSSGTGIQEQAQMEISGIKNLWSLKYIPESTIYDKYLVISFIGETRILAIENNELSECEISGFITDQSSLHINQLLSHLYIQITADSIQLIDSQSLSLLSSIPMSKSIIGASSLISYVLIALSGGTVMSYNVATKQLIQTHEIHLDHDVACMTMYECVYSDLLTSYQKFSTKSGISSSTSAPHSDAMDVASSDVPSHSSISTQNIILSALGMWTDGSIRLYDTTTMTELARINTENDAQTRSLLFIQFDKILYLFIGLGDGTLIYHQIIYNMVRNTWSFENKKKMIIGTRALGLSTFTSTSTGNTCIFISGDRPQVIYYHHNKILFSSITMNDITHMTSFHSSLFPNSLAISSENGFLIGQIDDIKKVHIHSYPIHQSPRRITYHNTSGVFAVCTENITKVPGYEKVTGHVHFYKESTMATVFSYDLDPLEQALSCQSCRLASTETHPQGTEYIIIGTGYVHPNEYDVSKGRILVFEIEKSIDDYIQVSLLTETDVQGAVFSIAQVIDKFVAGVNHKIQLYSLKMGTNTSSSNTDSTTKSIVMMPELIHEHTLSGNVLSLYIKSHSPYILVGDILRSMVLYKYTSINTAEGVGPGKLVEVARDYNTSSMRGIEFLGNNQNAFIGADSDGNLMTLNSHIKEGEESKLVNDGYYHLGDLINVIRHGSLISQISQSSTMFYTPPNTLNLPPNSKNITEKDDNTMNIVKSTHGSTDTSTLMSNDIGASSITDNTTTTTTTTATTNLTIMNSILYGTINGTIGNIILLDERHYQFFSALEKVMKSHTVGIGGLSHEDYRSYTNEFKSHPVRNFVDGDLIEKILELNTMDIQEIVRALNEEMSNLSYNNNNNDIKSRNEAKLSKDYTLDMTQQQQIQLQKTMYTVDDVIRRVEDIARMH